jgi:hypothetical protein
VPERESSAGKKGNERPSGTESEIGPPAWPNLGYWMRVAVAVIGIVVALRVVLILQGVLLVVLASLVLALGMQPAISYLEEKGVNRGWALAGILIVLNVFLIAGAWIIIPMAVDQVDEIGDAIPEIQEELRNLGGLGRVVANQMDPSCVRPGLRRGRHPHRRSGRRRRIQHLHGRRAHPLLRPRPYPA